MPRQNTKLESEGAEFLVLGHLLTEAIPAYKMYVNAPGYDVMAVNPEQQKVAKISVKSRWKASAKGFIINNLDSDFVVIVKLNKGTPKPLSAQFFVIPTSVIASLPRSGWGKINFTAIPNFQNYEGAWHSISEYIGLTGLVELEEEE